MVISAFQASSSEQGDGEEDEEEDEEQAIKAEADVGDDDSLHK